LLLVCLLRVVGVHAARLGVLRRSGAHPEQIAIAATLDLGAAVRATTFVERLDEVVRSVGGPFASLLLIDAVG
jgi:hypothetical protein